MNQQVEEKVKTYLRESKEKRIPMTLLAVVVAAVSLALAVVWPKSYTASSSIYPDNSNILKPLMEGNAVATGIVDQARLARDILFKREFTDDILRAGGWDPSSMTALEKEQRIRSVQDKTEIANISRAPATLIRISHTDQSPVRAFSIAQRYTSIFLEQSVLNKQQESRSAFEFIENQVASYQAKLQASEDRLSKFKSQNNFGTLNDSNNRIAGYRAEMERINLDLVQLDTQIASVESQLAGETEVSRDLSQLNAVRTRINNLQMQLDSLRSRFHDTYPDVMLVKTQIQDLQRMLETGNISIEAIEPNDNGESSDTPLRQQLRSQLAALKTSKEAKLSQLDGIEKLYAAEQERATMINENEAELAELTRDYNVTRDFYNEMLRRLESARVSVQLDEQEQGVTFKVQESAVIPTQPDGLAFRELMMGSFALSLMVPFGLLILFVELDSRIRSESRWDADWPPLLATVPPLATRKRWRLPDSVFLGLSIVLLIGLYATVGTLYLLEYI